MERKVYLTVDFDCVCRNLIHLIQKVYYLRLNQQTIYRKIINPTLRQRVCVRGKSLSAIKSLTYVTN